MIEQSTEPITPSAQDVARALDALHQTVNFLKPYLSRREAAAYTGRSLKAFDEFARRHGIVRMGDGTIARRDLDRIKRQPWTEKRGPKGHPSRQSQKAR